MSSRGTDAARQICSQEMNDTSGNSHQSRAKPQHPVGP